MDGRLLLLLVFLQLLMLLPLVLLLFWPLPMQQQWATPVDARQPLQGLRFPLSF